MHLREIPQNDRNTCASIVIPTKMAPMTHDPSDTVDGRNPANQLRLVLYTFT